MTIFGELGNLKCYHWLRTQKHHNYNNELDLRPKYFILAK